MKTRSKAVIGALLSLKALHRRGRIFIERPLTDETTLPLKPRARLLVSQIGKSLKRNRRISFVGRGKYPPSIFIKLKRPVFAATPDPQTATVKDISRLFRFFDQRLED